LQVHHADLGQKASRRLLSIGRLVVIESVGKIFLRMKFIAGEFELVGGAEAGGGSAWRSC